MRSERENLDTHYPAASFQHLLLSPLTKRIAVGTAVARRLSFAKIPSTLKGLTFQAPETDSPGHHVDSPSPSFAGVRGVSVPYREPAWQAVNRRPALTSETRCSTLSLCRQYRHAVDPLTGISPNFGEGQPVGSMEEAEESTADKHSGHRTHFKVSQTSHNFGLRFAWAAPFRSGGFKPPDSPRRGVQPN